MLAFDVESFVFQSAISKQSNSNKDQGIQNCNFVIVLYRGETWSLTFR
jgi:hypothetical protein